MKVLLVDMQMGNLKSVARALTRAGAEVEVSGDPARVALADRVVVPGQGHFGDCAAALEGGLGEALLAHIRADRPYLGICLGMQILFEGSEEAEGAAGLSVLGGRVRRFQDGRPDPEDPERRLKVPHTGWNEVRPTDEAPPHPLLATRDWFYFVHSYHCVPKDERSVVGRADYGEPFCAAVAEGSVFACQFHPEKSQRAGARLLTRFLEDGWS